jgi:type I restriction enzyme R subunit
MQSKGETMTTHHTEADARILIDDLLREALWDPADKSQVLTEVHIQIAKEMVIGRSQIAEPVSEYESGHNGQEEDSLVTGRADYVLRNQNGRPLAVIEAKKNAINPYVAKQQALPYAKALGAPFIFLTNGELIYFWDYQNDDARIVASSGSGF